MASVTEFTTASTDRWHYSTWFLTINTNQRNFDKNLLRDVLRRLFESNDMFGALIIGVGPETIDLEFSNVQFSIEVGPQTGYVHSHVLIRIRHRGNLRVNLNLLRNVLEKSLGLSGIHLDIHGMGNSTLSLIDYIRKNPSS